MYLQIKNNPNGENQSPHLECQPISGQTSTRILSFVGTIGFTTTSLTQSGSCSQDYHHVLSPDTTIATGAEPGDAC